MIKNYLKTAFRSLKKNKGFTLMNVFGLSVGLATCLLIVVYVVDELSYDKYNVNADRIFRVTEKVRLNGNEASYAGTEKPLPNALKALPGIEKVLQMAPVNSLFISPKKFMVRKGNNNLKETNIIFTETGLFDVFTLPVIDGKPNLNEPGMAVITESAAKKYFDTANATGKTLTINDTTLYKVTAVIEDVPSQSHFNFDVFLSFSSLPESKLNAWGMSGYHNYVLLKPGADIAKLEKQIEAIEYNNYPASIHANGNYLKVELKPITSIHLRSTSLYELAKTGTIQYVYIFSAIAILILLIACVNFMNLSTARSANRAKEVGVRKVLGSARISLIGQFLTESVLVTLTAAIIAVVLAWIGLPVFNQLAAKQLSFAQTLAWLLPLLLIIVLAVGFIAGAYPAFVLSAFRPVEVLKGKLAAGFKASALRNFLVVFQFSISIFLIIGTLVIRSQLTYIQSKDLGFDRSQVLVIKNTGVLGDQAAVLKQQLKEMTEVQNVTMSTYMPTSEERHITGMFPELPIDIKQDVLSEFWPVDQDYMKTLGIKLLSGRNFSDQMASDSSGLIVNEAFVKKFGFKDPIGKTVYRASFGIQQFHIVGVMKDFNFSSLHDEVKPVALTYSQDNGAIAARIKTSDLKGLISAIEARWKALSPNNSFTYSFMDEDFDATYRSELRTGQIFFVFSSIAIIIASLGLFGLAAYAAEQRTKEIGIRKVLGASASTIVGMLSKDFIVLVLIAIVIASPLAWFAMHKWLQGFAYRQNMEWWVVVLAGGIAMLIAFVTISFQSVKAALVNPVKSLRSE